MQDDWTDWPEDRECCTRGVMMRSFSGCTPIDLCLEGTAGYDPQNIRLTESYRMFGELERIL